MTATPDQFMVSHSVQEQQPMIHADVFEDDDDSQARSAFGTKAYWDDVYAGRGDFPADEYSWYYGWETLGKSVREYIPLMTQEGHLSHLLVPGIGNDPLLLDLLKTGYRKVTAQDYSEHAVERQQDLLSFESEAMTRDVTVSQGNVRQLPFEWSQEFDAILEKGLLDAVYLSGDGHVEEAVQEFHRVLKPGGIFMSVSGVVPHDLRKNMLNDKQWKWLKDGSSDLKAGCFVFQKL